eukprot:COSAG06_NODE_3431_length_5356_cov_5.474796_3_plen_32_part_00
MGRRFSPGWPVQGEQNPPPKTATVSVPAQGQ